MYRYTCKIGHSILVRNGPNNVLLFVVLTMVLSYYMFHSFTIQVQLEKAINCVVKQNAEELNLLKKIGNSCEMNNSVAVLTDSNSCNFKSNKRLAVMYRYTVSVTCFSHQQNWMAGNAHSHLIARCMDKKHVQFNFNLFFSQSKSSTSILYEKVKYEDY